MNLYPAGLRFAGKAAYERRADLFGPLSGRECGGDSSRKKGMSHPVGIPFFDRFGCDTVRLPIPACGPPTTPGTPGLSGRGWGDKEKGEGLPWLGNRMA